MSCVTSSTITLSWTRLNKLNVPCWFQRISKLPVNSEREEKSPSITTADLHKVQYMHIFKTELSFIWTCSQHLPTEAILHQSSHPINIYLYSTFKQPKMTKVLRSINTSKWSINTISTSRPGATLLGSLEEANTVHSVLLLFKERNICDSQSLTLSKHLWMDLSALEELGTTGRQICKSSAYRWKET